MMSHNLNETLQAQPPFQVQPHHANAARLQVTMKTTIYRTSNECVHTRDVLAAMYKRNYADSNRSRLFLGKSNVCTKFVND